MISTGIVRHFDDLGRIVIPRVIREKMKIKENDPAEIYADYKNNQITLHLYTHTSNKEKVQELKNQIMDDYWYADETVGKVKAINEAFDTIIELLDN